MAIFVDKLRDFGWKLGKSCHLITDGENEELHKFAKKIGMKQEWFQKSTSGPHYDLTAKRRELAVQLGAIPLEDQPFHVILKSWRAKAKQLILACTTEEQKSEVRKYLFR